MEVEAWHDLPLQEGLASAIQKCGWSKPTKVQKMALQSGLCGNDLLVRAATGSGKTAVFLIPMIEKICLTRLQKVSPPQSHISAMVVVPSRELSQQTCQAFETLSKFLKICVANLSESDDIRSMLNSRQFMHANILVGTPTRILAFLEKNGKICQNLSQIAYDEADLLYSYGYKQDLKKLKAFLPSTIQSFVLSATLSKDAKSLSSYCQNNPILIAPAEGSLPSKDKMLQHFIACDEVEDKFLIFYSLLCLKLLKGRFLIFVNSINSAYKLKLFMERFGFASVVLNSEMPLNSRIHVLEQFNSQKINSMIATDEMNDLVPFISEHVKDGDEPQDSSRINSSHQKSHEETKMAPDSKKCEHLCTVSRGIDFIGVDHVINFEFPPTVASYIHRAGRTARADSNGTVTSFVNGSDEMSLLKKIERFISNEQYSTNNNKIDNDIDDLDAPQTDNQYIPQRFDLSQVIGLKYRCEDAMKSATKCAITAARRKEIKVEVFNSKKLQNHFKANPQDKLALKHDHFHQPKFNSVHLRQLPDYLIPMSMKNSQDMFTQNEKAFNTRISSKALDWKPMPKWQKDFKFTKHKKSVIKLKKKYGRHIVKAGRYPKRPRARDPLKSMKFSKRR